MQKIVLGVVLFLLALTLYSLVDIITSSSSEKEPAYSVKTPKSERKTDILENAVNLQEKKRRFIHAIAPAVQKVKHELDAEYARAKMLASREEQSAEDAVWLQEKMVQYNVSGYPCLLRRMKTHPVSLVIAQAALETGWGSSRFFKEANNVFGIWSYDSREPRIAASETRGEKTIYVKKFATLDDAIRGYFKMISDGYAYGAFRKARMRSDNPFELLRYLRHYSELRDEYVARLYYVMKTNKLYQYDAPAYKPIALAKIIPEYVAQKREAAQKRASPERQMLALNEVKVESEDENRTVPCNEANRSTPPAALIPGG